MTPEQQKLREAVIAAIKAKGRYAKPGTVADAAIAVALEEAARMAKGAWLNYPLCNIADVDVVCGLCEDLSDAILALIQKGEGK